MTQTRPLSSLDADRQQDRHQVDDRRGAILDAAEALFLRSGLEQTTMVDIANAAGINKVTLYRYFANRDVIALEIHARMLSRIAALITPGKMSFSIEASRQLARQMIEHFNELRDTYRYMGMFDMLYLDQPAEGGVPQRTKDWLVALEWGGASFAEFSASSVNDSRCIVMLSTTIWFLEKLALRGELTWSDQSIPLEVHLRVFEEMIMGYMDRFVDDQQGESC